MTKLTPAQQQYKDLKKQHPDCLLLFRLGDFYELFYEDAHIASKVLGITLTARDKTAPTPIPMAGIPYHALDKYLPVLMKAGYKVAVADQVGDVVPGRLVTREIASIYTPGTWTDQGSEAVYLFACATHAQQWYGVWGDSSLGIWTVKVCDSYEELVSTIYTVSPREVVCNRSFDTTYALTQRGKEKAHILVSCVDEIPDAASMMATVLPTTSGDIFAHLSDPGVQQVCALLFSYLSDLKQPYTVRRAHLWQERMPLLVDHLTIKNLEIFQGSYQGHKKQSLFAVMDTTQTPMGSRLLADRLAHPTQDLTSLALSAEHIRYRQTNYSQAKHLQKALAKFGDIPRYLQNIQQGKRTIPLIRQCAEQVEQFRPNLIQFFETNRYDAELISTVHEFSTYVLSYISSDPSDQSHRIAPGQDPEVDRLRSLDEASDTTLLAYQQAWIARAGVQVKITYISNQGYFLEVTPKDIAKFETFIDHSDERWSVIRAQTLKTGQRYTSSYLQALQRAILEAKENLTLYHKQQEHTLLLRFMDLLPAWYAYTDMLADIDLCISMAGHIHQQGWVLPDIIPQGDLIIEEGRHPVVEAFLPNSEHFIPNSITCTEEHFFHIITGPNMGGKSTYMRQQALILLLAHAGLPVPAKKASVPCIDGIFARIGSGDVLAQQQSTFMTEMMEMAFILHHATHRSFLIIDELGRGTSTTDGLALAKAIIVYICQQIKAKTLFATHYHELISLAGSLQEVENWHVGVHETDQEVVFLKKIYRGGADKSYGLDVAKLAGIPASVLSIAGVFLEEQQAGGNHKQKVIYQESLFSSSQDSADQELIHALREHYGGLDVTAITPLDALYILQEIILKLRK